MLPQQVGVGDNQAQVSSGGVSQFKPFWILVELNQLWSNQNSFRYPIVFVSDSE
jgi:hypothetical protein